MAIFGLFRYFGPFEPFFASFGIPAEGCFTSTPRAGALYRLFWGSEDPGPGRPGEALLGPKLGKSPKSGDSGSGPRRVSRAREGRRAPARGVDVKPPSAAGSETGPRGPRGPRTLWIPIPGFRSPGGLSRPPEGAGDPPRTPSGGVVLHQPLAAGPCPGPGGVPGVPGVPETWSEGSPPPRVGAEGPHGVCGASRPQAGH